MGVALADITTGMYACNAILAALMQRERTGAGQHIDVALLDSMVAALANQALNFLVSGRSPGRLGNAHPNIVPYAVFTASDAPFIVAVGNDGQFRKLCALLGVPELGSDARFNSNVQRVANRAELTALLNERLSVNTVAHWLPRLGEYGIPAGPINTIEQVFADPHVRHRGLELALQREGLGTVPGVACPIRLSEAQVTSTLAPPALGSGTRAVLKARLDMSDADLDTLERSGTISS